MCAAVPATPDVVTLPLTDLSSPTVIVPVPEALVVTAGTSWLPLSATLTSAAWARLAREATSIAAALILARSIRLIVHLLSVVAWTTSSSVTSEARAEFPASLTRRPIGATPSQRCSGTADGSSPPAPARPCPKPARQSARRGRGLLAARPDGVMGPHASCHSPRKQSIDLTSRGSILTCRFCLPVRDGRSRSSRSPLPTAPRALRGRLAGPWGPGPAAVPLLVPSRPIPRRPPPVLRR